MEPDVSSNNEELLEHINDYPTWRERIDILSGLVNGGLRPMAEQVLDYLDLTDLKCCQLVCTSWFGIIDELWHHHEFHRIDPNWSLGTPRLDEIQCHRERSVCTVSSITLDESSILCALGGSGRIEMWDRRTLTRMWDQIAHKDGVYSVDLGTKVAVSGGDDAKVKIWNKHNGDLLETLEHHEFIVWNVKLWVDQLVTCSYDCSMAFFQWNEPWSQFRLTKHVKGHLAWADGIATDSRGKFLATHSEETFEISIWRLADGIPLEHVTSSSTEMAPLSPETQNGLPYTHELLTPSTILKGHTDEVNCVKIREVFVFSGGCDQTIRVWNIDDGSCLTVLKGHEGKIWCLDVDRHRIVSGGRFGEILIWSWSPEDVQDECPSRTLRVHSKTTAVGQIKMDRALLVSADGLGKIVLCNFWNLEHS